MSSKPAIDKYYRKLRLRVRIVIVASWFACLALGLFAIMLLSSRLTSLGLRSDSLIYFTYSLVAVTIIGCGYGIYYHCCDHRLRKVIIGNLILLFPEQSRYIETYYSTELVGASAQQATEMIHRHLADNLPLKWSLKILTPPGSLQRMMMILTVVLFVLLFVGGGQSIDSIQNFSEELLQTHRFKELDIIKFKPRFRWLEPGTEKVKIEIELDRVIQTEVTLETLIDNSSTGEPRKMTQVKPDSPLYILEIKPPKQDFSVVIHAEDKSSSPQYLRYIKKDLIKITKIEIDEGVGFKKINYNPNHTLNPPRGSKIRLQFMRIQSPLVSIEVRNQDNEIIQIKRDMEPRHYNIELRVESNESIELLYQLPSLEIIKVPLVRYEPHDVFAPEIEIKKPVNEGLLNTEKGIDIQLELKDDFALGRVIIFITDYREINLVQHIEIKETKKFAVIKHSIDPELLELHQGTILAISAAVIDNDPRPKITFSPIIHLLNRFLPPLNKQDLELTEEFWKNLKESLKNGNTPQLALQDYDIWQQEKMAEAFMQQSKNKMIDKWYTGLKNKIVEENNGGIDPKTGKPFKYIYRIVDGQLERVMNPNYQKTITRTKIIDGKLVTFNMNVNSVRPYVPATQFIFHAKQDDEKILDFIKGIKINEGERRKILTSNEWEGRLLAFLPIIEKLDPKDRRIIRDYYQRLRLMQE